MGWSNKITKCLSCNYSSFFHYKICFGHFKVWMKCCCGEKDGTSSPIVTLCTKKEIPPQKKEYTGLEGNVEIWFQMTCNCMRCITHVCPYAYNIKGMQNVRLTNGIICCKGNINLQEVQERLQNVLCTPPIFLNMLFKTSKPKEDNNEIEDQNLPHTERDGIFEQGESSGVKDEHGEEIESSGVKDEHGEKIEEEIEKEDFHCNSQNCYPNPDPYLNMYPNPDPYLNMWFDQNGWPSMR